MLATSMSLCLPLSLTAFHNTVLAMLRSSPPVAEAVRPAPAGVAALEALAAAAPPSSGFPLPLPSPVRRRSSPASQDPSVVRFRPSSQHSRADRFRPRLKPAPPASQHLT